MKAKFLLLLAVLCASLSAQESDSNDPMQKLPAGVEEAEYFIREPLGLPQVQSRIEPQYWFIHMQSPDLELLVYAKSVASGTRVELAYPGVEIAYLEREENPNYLFIGLTVSPTAQAGKFPVKVFDADDKMVYQFTYELKPHPYRTSPPATSPVLNATQDRQVGTLQPDPRKAPNGGLAPLSSRDLIYLIMPDRFANGDRRNDEVEGMQQQGVNRDKFLFRHGGDLIGIMEHLDYLQELGVTAIWLNPVLENDQPYESYHGYAITDHSNIDRRLGSNEQYRQLVELAHERGMKVIMDVIFNHVGDQHWQIKDLPSNDWIHQWPEYTQTTYRATTLLDPNVADADRRLMTDGWFDKHMPDLNQQNPHLARYLIQNSIWWAAYSKHDAYRIDTYAYPDPAFMAEWNRRMLEEFPHIGIFGETWVHGPAVQAWFTGGNRLHPSFNTNLPGVTDFQLYYAINEALSKDAGWTDGVLRLYYTLAQDYLYDDPNQNVTFLDNHDLARFFTVVDGDMTKFKSGLAFLFTLRGIPMIYYGTELGFTGAGGAFGEGGRVDFPGGWRKDPIDLFDPQERSVDQQAIFDYIQQLAKLRQGYRALSEGKLVQFVPREGVFVYFRSTETQNIMVVFNGNNETVTTALTHYQSEMRNATSGTDAINQQTINLSAPLKLAPKACRIIILEE